MASAMTPQDKNGYHASAWHFAALVAGNIALALGPWLVRLSDTGPVSVGFWRLLMPIPLLGLLAWRTRTPGPIDRKLALMCLAAGAFFALDLASWHVGIEQTRLANATLFGNSGSIILMVWGLIAARRAPSGQEMVGVAAALTGAAILLGRSLEISSATFVGDLFCLLAGVFYAFYLLPAQHARGGLGQWTVLLLVSIAAAPLLLAIALAAGEPVWPGEAGWTPVVALFQPLRCALVWTTRSEMPRLVALRSMLPPMVRPRSSLSRSTSCDTIWSARSSRHTRSAALASSTSAGCWVWK